MFRDKAQYPTETADLTEERREAGLVYGHYAEIIVNLKILLLPLSICFLIITKNNNHLLSQEKILSVTLNII